MLRTLMINHFPHAPFLQLKINTEGDRFEINPGDRLKLLVSGDSQAWVGFNIMDEALLLLNNKHILKENTVRCI